MLAGALSGRRSLTALTREPPCPPELWVRWSLGPAGDESLRRRLRKGRRDWACPRSPAPAVHRESFWEAGVLRQSLFHRVLPSELLRDVSRLKAFRQEPSCLELGIFPEPTVAQPHGARQRRSQPQARLQG